MERPELKLLHDMTEADFQHHAVWIGCHTVDYDESWYCDTYEDTFRPWVGSLPVPSTDYMYVVRATARLADGTTFPAFLSPGGQEGNLGAIQPYLFAAGSFFGFWTGIVGVTSERKDAFYRSIGKERGHVFPIRFEADEGLADGVAETTVEGFYAIGDGNQVHVEQ